MTTDLTRKVSIRKVGPVWAWGCNLCVPGASGANRTFGKTLRAVERHLHNRVGHHDWVLRSR